MNNGIYHMHSEYEGTVKFPLQPFIIGLIGKYSSGRSCLIQDMILQRGGTRFYEHDFEGKNIYIISPYVNTDPRYLLARQEKCIPPSNVFEKYTGGPKCTIDNIYNRIKEKLDEAITRGDNLINSLIIFDNYEEIPDIRYLVLRILHNSRSMLISVILSSQQHSDTLFFKDYYTRMLWNCD